MYLGTGSLTAVYLGTRRGSTKFSRDSTRVLIWKHQVSCFRTVAFRTETISPDNARVFLKSTCLRGSGGTRAVQLPNVYLIPGISKEYRYF